MKKLIIILAIVITILAINKEEDKIIIPKDSIRFRVIANSDTEKDQNLKKEIVFNFSKTIAEANNLKNIDDTRNYINKNLPKFESIVNETLKEKDQDKTFNINFGKNYFPKKRV